MIKVAKLFIGCSVAQICRIREFYNDECYPLVKPTRRYKMQIGDNWCAMFTSVVAKLAGVEWFPYEVSVGEQKKLAVAAGRWYDAGTCVPESGWLVVYDWTGNGWPDHVGIVEGYRAGSLVVIEGNYQGGVGVRVVSAKAGTIAGYIKTD